MEVKVTVRYGDGVAHYALSPESGGVYQAQLLRWEGGTIAPPPREITLVKGARQQWVGSCDRPTLLQDLGRALEGRVRSGEPNAPW